jgi:RluA family pseudouridine synthase
MSLPVTNISAYRFAPLTDLKSLRGRLLETGRALGLKGTILLSTEGINLFLAGSHEAIESLVAELRALPGLADLAPKYSVSAEQPFRRLLVRIKKEIIAFGVDGIDPARHSSPRLSARELKQWLDEGRPVTLLDTRNDYEIKLGTFKGALVPGIDHFRDFPAAVQRLPRSLKNQPVVTFCTGGIRCEKAAPFLEREGFEQVWQLEGGILKYFEEVGGDHYEGECFVFDQRVGVDPALRETETAQCYACQAPLTAEEQEDPRYVEGQSCPYCHQSDAEKHRQRREQRQLELQAAVEPLPGCLPYDNQRPLSIPERCEGQTLLEALLDLLPGTERLEWLRLIEQGRLLDPAGAVATPDLLVRAGERYLRLLPGHVEPPVNAAIRLIHEDEAIVVLHKPAPLPVHPGGRFNRNSLVHLLQLVYAPQKLRPVHRLDANTSGLMVLARTRRYAGLLQTGFARGEVDKLYRVRVRGHPENEAWLCEAPIGEAPNALGCREVDEEAGLPARTEFRVVRREDDGTTLLDARPVTGRTNQIRIHLSQAGLPVCGDPAYLTDGRIGEVQTLDPAAPPLCLHAWQLAFTHPLSGERLSFTDNLPNWAR